MKTLLILRKRLAFLCIAITLLSMFALPAEVGADSTGWQAKYYNNIYLWGTPVLTRVDSSINFNWGTGSPGPGVNADNFSVRWVRTLYMDGGRYRFNVETDDGVRLFLDGAPIIDQWKDQPPTYYSVERDVPAGNHTIQMEYYENRGVATARLWWEKISTAPSDGYWLGEYFNNRYLSGTPAFTRYDSAIDFDWGLAVPDSRIGADNFSVRWTRTMNFETARYRFIVEVDDGVRLFIDGVLVINQWRDQPVTMYTVERDMTAGPHTIKMEYYENTGGAIAKLRWHKVTPGPPPVSGQWRGEYYTNPNLAGAPALVRNDAEIRFDWGNGSPNPIIPADRFSVRWTREVYFTEGRWEFKTRTDDGVRLYVDGRRIIDEWEDMSPTTFKTVIHLSQGWHTITMEYYENMGRALAELSWRGPIEVPSGGNLITCLGTARNSWIKAYQLTADGTWLDVNPRGWGPINPSGYLKIDGLPVDHYTFGPRGNPYRVELWIEGRLIYSVGNTAAGQPEFRIRANTDNYTPWGCSPW